MWCLTAAAGRTSSYYRDIRDSKEIAKHHHHEFDEEKARLLTVGVRLLSADWPILLQLPRLNDNSTVAIIEKFVIRLVQN